jgi:hypothetical protein
MLSLIKEYFGNAGQITISKTNNVYRYVITKQADLIKIKTHFDKYPLLTKKIVDYLL